MITCHPGTPWELLAKRELELPLGWNWTEEYTDLTPRRDGAGGNGGRPRDDVRNVERKPPKREPPRL